MSRPRTSRAVAEPRAQSGDPVPISAEGLRAAVRDAAELQKGTRLLDDGLLSHFARFQNRIFCEAKGSAPAPYRVVVAFLTDDEDGTARLRLRPRCTCPAARARPICKHAAGLLVAWSRAPEAFVTGAAPPAGAPGEKKRTVRRGSAAANTLMSQGVEQIETLVRELAVAGVAVADTARARAVRTLGESLREYRLRRLSARSLDLAVLLDAAAAKPAARGAAASSTGALDPIAFADVMLDLLLTARKIARHVAGEPLADAHVEELVGKTWRANERAKIEGLDLLEYAFIVSTTSDDFVIRESRFFDLAPRPPSDAEASARGDHLSEKQIVPAFLSRMTEPKLSRAGFVHAGARASMYPGFAPRRIEITDLGDARPVDDAALAALEARALPDVGAALAALRAHRRDVFAPERLPVAIRTDAIVARGDRLEVVDAGGRTLHLPATPELEARISDALRDGALRVLLGDVGVEAALPTLFPLALVVRGEEGARLSVLATGEASKKRGKAPPARVASWADVARAANASEATVALGEVREELASALVDGLAAFGRRVGDPLAARLRELGLGPQADLLDALVARADPFERVADFARLYQVLSTALLRLASALTIDREELVRVPSFESIFVALPDIARARLERPMSSSRSRLERPMSSSRSRLDPTTGSGKPLAPSEIAARSAAGELNRYEAAALEAAWFGAMPEAELWARADELAANGSASPFVEAALAARGEIGAARALGMLESVGARVAKITAMRALARPESMGGAAARAALSAVRRGDDPGLAAHADVAFEALVRAEGGRADVDGRWAARAARIEELRADLDLATSAAERTGLVRELLATRDLRAASTLRRLHAADPSRAVRSEAAAALALLGDVELVAPLLRALAERNEDEALAVDAARALGALGDARAAPALVAALVEGWKPAAVRDAVIALGHAATVELLDRIVRRPELAERKPLLRVFAGAGPDLVGDLEARLGRLEEADVQPVGRALSKVASAASAAHAGAFARALAARLGEKVGDR